MAQFAQLSDQHPVLQTTPVASRAQGHQVMSKLFGEVAQVAGEEAISIAKEHSSAMLMNGAAQSKSMMNDAQIQLLKHPNQAGQIQESMMQSLDAVKNTSVNDADRSKLNAMVESSKDTLKLGVARVEVKQSRLENEAALWSSLPGAMQQYREALYKMTPESLKQAETYSQTILSNFKNGMIDQTVTPQQYMNVQKSLMDGYDRVQELHDIVGDDNASSEQVQAHAVDVASENNLGVADLPSDHITQHLKNHYHGTMTQHDMEQQIAQGHLGVGNYSMMSNYMNQTKAQWADTAQLIIGSRIAHGKINNNGPLPEIEAKIIELENNHNRNSSQDSQLNVYNNYVKDLDAGISTNERQAQTTEGAKILNHWNATRASIDKYVGYKVSPQENENQKAFYRAQADNDMIDQMQALGEAQHMAPGMNKPVPAGMVSKAESAFITDGDPQQLLSTLGSLKMRNGSLLAQQMQKGTHSQIVGALAVGLHNKGNPITPAFANRLIAANQDHRDFSALKTEDAEKDSVIKAQLQSNVDGILKYLDASGGTESSTDFVQSGLNYVKYRALQNRDFTINDAKSYIKEFTKEMEKGYNLRESAGGMINLSQNQISSFDQDALQTYVQHEAQKEFAGVHGDDDNYAAGSFKTDMTVFIDTTNHVTATDQDGNSFYYAPYSPHLIAAAKQFLNPKNRNLSADQQKADVEFWTEVNRRVIPF